MAISVKSVSFKLKGEDQSVASSDVAVMSNTIVSVEGTQDDFTVKVPVNGLGLKELVGTNVSSSGSITLSGGIGNITALTVAGVQIFDVLSPIVGATPADLPAQALALAVAINDYTSVPNYTASSSGAVVTIEAAGSVGTGANTHAVVGTKTGALTLTAVAFSGGTNAMSAFITAAGTIFSLPLLAGGSVNLNAYGVRSIVPTATGSSVYYSDEFGLFVNVYESSSTVVQVTALIDALI